MKQDLSNAETGAWLVEPTSSVFERTPALQNRVFLGVDFGTATTVVSQVILAESAGAFSVQPLTISQPSAHGGVIRDALVNTVLSYRSDTLLFGQDAYNLRPRLTEGRNTFSSFKMGLGLDLGPEYAATVLPNGRVPGVTVERPSDATREFFKLLCAAIHDELRATGQSSQIKFAFTVPAAFQANQRRDLLKAIGDCGIEVDESCLIDEPNAAFLSYIYEMARTPGGCDIIARARQGKVNILV
jgi:molecular chaperone DnaK (HSP70)